MANHLLCNQGGNDAQEDFNKIWLQTKYEVILFLKILLYFWLTYLTICNNITNFLKFLIKFLAIENL